jgi:tagatose-1,6-bisphosphate aldolase non-catalytic subunit AgaZ/GatZ
LGIAIPAPVLQQFLPRLVPTGFATDETCDRLILASIDEVLRHYAGACAP